jgi:CheY-like chemotaxis protein/HPt (histidine-containing phosphotransfer) domain-containing protein
VNQLLAIKILSKRGHEVVVAANGQEALDAWKARAFDAILMDVQMPIMDGVEATQIIRAEEAATGHRIPIIALTAHAMKGDRERFLAAGMDAFIAKPLRTDELLNTLTRLTYLKTPSKGSSPGMAGVRNSAAGIPRSDLATEETILDRTATLARVEGDRELLQVLIGMFESQSTDLLAEIRTSVHQQNGHGLERAAHKLKGSVGTFGAQKAVISAQTLETSGRQNQWEGVEDACGVLERQVARLKQELAELEKGGAA